MYRYVLPTSVNVSNNYRIGVYQPEDDKSVVRLYTAPVSNVPITIGKIRLNSINNKEIKISGSKNEIELINDATEAFMVHPITGKI